MDRLSPRAAFISDQSTPPQSVPLRDVAVLVPCCNEELTVGKVIDDFLGELPGARIYIFDNNSSDATAAVALKHGAKVVKVPLQGKGRAVQAIFDKVTARYYVLVDGDDTYPAGSVRLLLEPVMRGETDMSVGSRLQSHHRGAFRPLHKLGNALVCALINRIWNVDLEDIMSGYRVFNVSVARGLPLISSGFEIETEMTLQMLDKGFRIQERPIPYGARPRGSVSKLRTFRDGANVLFLIFRIFKDYKPLTFFGGLGILGGVLAMLLCIIVWSGVFSARPTYQITATVVSVGLAVMSVISIHIGLTLHTINWKLKEIYSLLRREGTEKANGDFPALKPRRDDYGNP